MYKKKKLPGWKVCNTFHLLMHSLRFMGHFLQHKWLNHSSNHTFKFSKYLLTIHSGCHPVRIFSVEGRQYPVDVDVEDIYQNLNININVKFYTTHDFNVLNKKLNSEYVHFFTPQTFVPYRCSEVKNFFA